MGHFGAYLGPFAMQSSLRWVHWEEFCYNFTCRNALKAILASVHLAGMSTSPPLHPPDRYRQSAEWTMEWTIKFTPPHLSSTWSSRPCTPTYGLPIKVHTFSSSSLRNSTGMKLKFCEWYLNVEVALSKKQKLLSVSFSFCLSLSLGTKLKPQHIALSFSIWHSRSQWSRCRVFRSGSA